MNHKNNDFQLNSPYPPVKVKNPNTMYAEILMDDYAGTAGELTAITQYLYHHFESEKTNPQIAKLFEGVALVEMHHLEILAKLIIAFGGNPTYRGSFGNNFAYWSGHYVNYSQNIREQLIADIHAEKTAIVNYQKHAEIIDDPYARPVLYRIIEDEELHLKLFKDALKSLREG
ncbi:MULTISPECIES: ferritin-like domain-containing protein [Carboxydothermus]|uniref:CotJC protein n=2 Tax=Carboxydothermus TaxID=129957 RepID=Q3A9V3_CARHZ|nr:MULTISPECIES: manganese catalase family protein [Carboxydothermus]ABB13705.1 cotJC protein [Carboxydothermus hydrogenoformans Z-2901]NYE57978.1 bacterioferritin [Carboxydothermus ferrireducens DSM 11255]